MLLLCSIHRSRRVLRGLSVSSNSSMKPLHIAFDIALLATLATVGLGTLGWWRDQEDSQLRTIATAAAVQTIQTHVSMESTLGGPQLNSDGFPSSIDPRWFEGGTPLNRLAPEGAPWVELAARDEADRIHPKQMSFSGGRHAMFWYNPTKGVVRARVPEQASDLRTKETYSAANGIATDAD